MNSQNGPVVACEKSSWRDGWVVELKLRDDLADSKAAHWSVGRVAEVAVPEIHTIRVEEYEGQLHLKVETNDSSVVRNLASQKLLNDLLSRFTGCWVENIVIGNLPMQALVAVKYRLSDPHLKHLTKVLTTGDDPLVRHVVRAHPHNLYNGFVLGLLVPRLDEGSIFSRVTSSVRHALTFEF